MWLNFTHLNIPHFTGPFTWKNMPLTLNRFKPNLPQIFPRLLHLQVLPGNATALTEQSEAKTLEVKAPLFHHWILWKYKALDTSQTHFSICRMKSLFYWVVITGSTTTEIGCTFAIFSPWGMNIYFFPNTFISKRTDWLESSGFENIKSGKRLGMRRAESTAVGLFQPRVLFWRPPVPANVTLLLPAGWPQRGGPGLATWSQPPKEAKKFSDCLWFQIPEPVKHKYRFQMQGCDLSTHQ